MLVLSSHWHSSTELLSDRQPSSRSSMHRGALTARFMDNLNRAATVAFAKAGS